MENLKELLKIQILEFVTKINMRHMASIVDDTLRTRTDGQGETSVPPSHSCVCVCVGGGGGGGGGGKKQYEIDKTAVNSGHREVRWIRKAKHE